MPPIFDPENTGENEDVNGHQHQRVATAQNAPSIWPA